MKRILLGPAIAGLLFILACGGATEESPPPPPPPPAYAIGVIEADTVDTVATTTRVTVEVVNAASATPAPGVLVNFVVVQGGGRVFAGVGLTDSIGRVRDLWTLGTVADTQVLEARAVDPVTGDPIVYARAVLRALPGPATTAVIDTTPIHLFLGDSIDLTPRRVQAADRYGNPIDTIAAWQPGPAWQLRGGYLVNQEAAADRLLWRLGALGGSIETTAVPRLFEGATTGITFGCERSLGDTVHFAGQVDFAAYPGDSLYNPLIQGLVQLRYTVWDDRAGSVWSATQRALVFTPDSLVYSTVQNEPLGTGYVQGADIVGGNWCWAISYPHVGAAPGILTRR